MGLNRFLRSVGYYLKRRRSAENARVAKTSRRRPFRPLLEVLEDRITPVTGLTPAQICSFYGINAIAHFGALNAGGGQIADGTGQTIAIVAAFNDPQIVQDLDTFDQAFSTTAAAGAQTLYQRYGGAVGGPAGSLGPGSFLKVFNTSDDSHTATPNDITSLIAKDNGTNGVPPNALRDGTAFETALDVEWAHAIAPGATIDLVEVHDGSAQSLLLGVDQAKVLPGVSVVSLSYTLAAVAPTDDNFVAQGVTFVVPSGDAGWPGNGMLSANTLVVGGTVLASDQNGNPVGETAWVDSGGGRSIFQGGELAPRYQQGENGQPAASTGDRTTPDVAFDGGTPVAVFDSYDFPSNSQTLGSGTSLGTPCWAGLVAIANQGRAVYNEPPLNTNASGNSADPQQIMDLLYGLPATDFNKITGGSNAQVTGVLPTQDSFVYKPTLVTIEGGNPTVKAFGFATTANGAITGFYLNGGSGYQAQDALTVNVTGEGSLTVMNPDGTISTAQLTPVIANGYVSGLQLSLNGLSEPFPVSSNGSPLVPFPQNLPFAQNGIGAGYLSIDLRGGQPTNGLQDIAIPNVNSNGQITDAFTGYSPSGAGGYRAVPTATIGGNVNPGAQLGVFIDRVDTAVGNTLWETAIAQGQYYNQVTGLGTPVANRLIPDLLGPQSRLSGIGSATDLAPATSDKGLALSAVNDQEFVAWRDSNQFLNIMPVKTDGTGDFAHLYTSPYTLNSSPALATLNGQLYVAWVGENDGYQIYVSLVSVNGGTITLSPAEPVYATNTDNWGSPALAAFNGNLYLAWTDQSKQLNIDKLATDPTTGALVPNGNDTLPSERFPPVANLTVNGSPALAASGGKFFVAWAGQGNNNILYDAQISDNGQSISLVNGVTLPETSDQWSSPALADLHGSPVIAWIGRFNHFVLVMALDNNGKPVATDPQPGYEASVGNVFDQLNGGPALGSIHGNVMVAWTNWHTQELLDAPVDFSPYTGEPVAVQGAALTLQGTVNDPNTLQVQQGATLHSYQAGTFNQIQVVAPASSTLTLDFSNGNFIPSGGLTFDGGSNGTLILKGGKGSFTNEVMTPTGPNSGAITLDGSVISYTNVSSIIDTTTVTNLTMTGTSSAEQVDFVNGPSGTDEINSASGTFAKVDFGNKTNVTFAGGQGADTYTVVITTAAANLSTLTLNGASPTGDTFSVWATLYSVPVTINAGRGTSTVNVTPFTQNLAFLGGALTVNGGAGGTTLLVVDDQLDPNSQTYTLTSSFFGGTNSARINYNNLAGVTLNGGTGAANLLAIQEGHNGGETWTASAGAQAGSVRVQGTGPNNTPVAGTPITAFGLKTLSIDTTLNAKQKPLPRRAGNTYVVSDLSTTGIRNVELDIAESQSGVASPDTITVDGTQASGTANMVDVRNNQVLGPHVEDVTLTKLVSRQLHGGGTTLVPVPSQKYTVSAGIPNSGDSLTVNTYAGPDQVHVYASAGAGSTYIKTGAGMGPGGDNQVIVGDATSATGLNDIEGPLFINAGNGSKNALTFTEAASLAGDTLTLTSDALIRYVSTPLPRMRQQPAQERYAFQISYQATGYGGTVGAFGGGIELDTTQGPDTIYVPSTVRSTHLTIDTGVNNSTNGKPPAPDQVFVGYDAGDPSGKPNPESAATLDEILSPLTIVGKGTSGTPATKIIVEDQGANQPAMYNLAWLSLPGIEDLQRSGASAIIYGGPQLAMTLNAGNQGNQISVQGVLPGTSATINAGNGANTLVVGNFFNNLNAVGGLLTLNGGTGTNHLTLCDEGAGAAAAYHLGANQLVRDPIAPEPAVTIDFVNMTTLDFKASDLSAGTKGSNTIVIQGTAAHAQTEVDTEHGTNNITVEKLNMIHGPLTLASLAGAVNSLAVDDSAANTPGTYFLNAGSVQGNGSAVIQFANFELVGLAPGNTQNNIVNVQSTAAHVAYVINCTTQMAASTDIFNVGDSTNTLSGILGPVSFLGGHGHGALMIDDQGSTAATTYALTSTTLARSRAAAITYKGLSSLVVNGGGGTNVFTASGTKAGTATALRAGAGADIIKMAGNAASYAGPLTIDGQGGVNTLDYSGFSGPVTVDLPLGIASAAAGGINHIQNLIGGSGNDLFVGNGAGNVLTGGTGRNILIAGARAGTLIGNADQDLLVGGTTKYDTNLLALSAIMAEWGNAAPYGIRVPLVLNGGGLNGTYHLGATDFTNNGGGNVLRGGPGLDLFYGIKALDSHDWNAGQGEVFVENQGKKATPTVLVSDAGGTYNGQAFAATATVAGVVHGVDDTPGPTLESVGLTLDYQQLYANGNVQSDLGSTPPSHAGSYRVTASFPGSTDYTSASSQPAAFTISKATPNAPPPAGVVIITYGTPVDNSQLSGIASTATINVNGQAVPVAGHYVYNGGINSILTVGSQFEPVAFEPTSTDFNAVIGMSTRIDVKQATPTIHVSDSGGALNGQPYAATATVAGTVAGVDNTLGPTLESVGMTLDYQQWVTVDGLGGNAWVDLGSTAPTAVGQYRVIASFGGSTDYASASAQVDFRIQGF